MKRKLVFYIIIVFSVIIMPLNNGHGQSMPMHLILYLAPFLLLVNANKLSKKDILPILLMLSIAMTGITHPEAFRLSTVLYSMMFIITFVYFTKLIDYSSFSATDLLRLSRLLVFAYAVILLLQHIGVLFNLSIINENKGIIYDGLKVNSLSNEPSHTGPIVASLFFTYLKMKEIRLGLEKISFKRLLTEDKWLVIAFYYTMLGSISVTCILAMLVISLYFIRLRHVLLGVFGVSLLSLLVVFSDTELGERIRVLIPVVLKMDPAAIYLIDSSASARIGPFLVYLQDFKVFDFNTWFGYGCDYGTRYVMDVMTGSQVEDDSFDIGGIVNFIYNYGLIPFLLFFIMITRITQIKSFLFFMYLTLFFVSPFNVHMTWLFIMLAYCITYFERRRFLCKSILGT